jgi:L-ribulose-5-phosphate 3-epimerase
MQGRLLPPENGRIQSFPIKSWRDEFPSAKRLKLELIEWTIDRQGLFQNPILTRVGQAEINELQMQHGVYVKSITCDNLMQAPVHKHGPQGITKNSELLKFLDHLPVLDRLILVWPIVDDGRVSTKDEMSNLVQIVNKIADICREKGIILAFETDFTPEENGIFLSNFPEDVVGINLDLGNSASYGNSIIEDFALNKDRVFNIHIKDRNYGGTTVPLGEGDVPWIDFAEKALPFFDGNLILQCARQSTISEVETIRRYLDFLSLKGLV